MPQVQVPVRVLVPALLPHVPELVLLVLVWLPVLAAPRPLRGLADRLLAQLPVLVHLHLVLVPLQLLPSCQSC